MRWWKFLACLHSKQNVSLFKSSHFSWPVERHCHSSAFTLDAHLIFFVHAQARACAPQAVRTHSMISLFLGLRKHFCQFVLLLVKMIRNENDFVTIFVASPIPNCSLECLAIPATMPWAFHPLCGDFRISPTPNMFDFAQQVSRVLLRCREFLSFRLPFGHCLDESLI